MVYNDDNSQAARLQRKRPLNEITFKRTEGKNKYQYSGEIALAFGKWSGRKRDKREDSSFSAFMKTLPKREGEKIVITAIE